MATTSRRPRSTSTKGHYITNAVLLPAVIEAKAKAITTASNQIVDFLISINLSF
jgi:hypothetical protein